MPLQQRPRCGRRRRRQRLGRRRSVAVPLLLMPVAAQLDMPRPVRELRLERSARLDCALLTLLAFVVGRRRKPVAGPLISV